MAVKSLVPTDNSLLDSEARRLGLTQQQRVAADTYLSNGFKIKDAVITAGYATNDKGAPHQSTMSLFIKPNIQQYLHVAIRDSMKRMEIDKDAVVRVIADIAFLDATTLYCELTNQPLPLAELTKQQRNAIKDVNTRKYKDKKTGKYITEVTGYILHDKSKALEMLGKHFGVFEADNEQSRAIINQQINVKWN